MESPVSAAELRLHVERIVDDVEFEESPRHRHLLRYLADHAIATGGRRLSPQTIESDVLSRGAGDSGRAVKPARLMVDELRSKLERYAAKAGRSDAIRVAIPPGDCRLEVTRPAVTTPSERKRLPAGTPRPVVMVVEFDAEPAVRSLAQPLASAIVERLLDHGGGSVISPVTRRQIAEQGLAVEHAPAAWDADAGVHGTLIGMPGERGLEGSIGASVRLINADAAVVWTLWCEEAMTAPDSEPALNRMADKIAGFVADGVELSGRHT